MLAPPVPSHRPEGDGLRKAEDSPQGLSSSVLSPCISVCRMAEASGLCEGCQRTIDEIAAWSRLDDDGKRVVWRAIGERRMALRLPVKPLPGDDA